MQQRVRQAPPRVDWAAADDFETEMPVEGHGLFVLFIDVDGRDLVTPDHVMQQC